MPLLNFLNKLVAQGKVRKKSPKKTKKKMSKKVCKKPREKAGKKLKKKQPKGLKKKSSFKPSKKLSPKPKEKEIGVITHYFGKIEVGIVKLKAVLRVGDEIHIKGAHDDFTQVVNSMQYNHKDISFAKKGLEVGIKVKQRVHENDKVYKR